VLKPMCVILMGFCIYNEGRRFVTWLVSCLQEVAMELGCSLLSRGGVICKHWDELELG